MGSLILPSFYLFSLLIALLSLDLPSKLAAPSLHPSPCTNPHQYQPPPPPLPPFPSKKLPYPPPSVCTQLAPPPPPKNRHKFKPSPPHPMPWQRKFTHKSPPPPF
ncbi:extensin-3-like [Cucurbita pepo subsp. pepo]|uniref:extensin-3-like n=1 Tax=Cucurbita pepo subsp. pepo TaxID=3664 RepID=UPI000C9D4203|nr:extensin-3-like [Cucurbita pepo subsp. pepo]